MKILILSTKLPRWVEKMMREPKPAVTKRHRDHEPKPKAEAASTFEKDGLIPNTDSSVARRPGKNAAAQYAASSAPAAPAKEYCSLEGYKNGTGNALRNGTYVVFSQYSQGAVIPRGDLILRDTGRISGFNPTENKYRIGYQYPIYVDAKDVEPREDPVEISRQIDKARAERPLYIKVVRLINPFQLF